MSKTNECPTCGADVDGCAESRDEQGRRVWTQLVKRTEKANGTRIVLGGLSHTEGGERCLRSVEQR